MLVRMRIDFGLDKRTLWNARLVEFLGVKVAGDPVVLLHLY